MAYDVDIPGSPTFLNQVGVFNTTDAVTPRLRRGFRSLEAGSGRPVSRLQPMGPETSILQAETAPSTRVAGTLELGAEGATPWPRISPPKMVVTDFFTSG